MSCLTAARGADEDDEFLVVDAEVHVLDGMNLIELLVQAADDDLSHYFITYPLTEPVRLAT